MWVSTFWLVTWLVVGSDFSVMTNLQTDQAGCITAGAANIDAAMHLQFRDGSHKDHETFVVCVIKRVWQEPT